MRISRTACAASAPVASSSLGPVAQVALLEQARAGDRFRRWAAKRCPDARLMNVGSDLQIRQLLFGGKPNCKDKDQSLPPSRVFKVTSLHGNTLIKGLHISRGACQTVLSLYHCLLLIRGREPSKYVKGLQGMII